MKEFIEQELMNIRFAIIEKDLFTIEQALNNIGYIDTVRGCQQKQINGIEISVLISDNILICRFEDLKTHKFENVKLRLRVKITSIEKMKNEKI